jgi:hypothetical protein
MLSVQLRKCLRGLTRLHLPNLPDLGLEMEPRGSTRRLPFWDGTTNVKSARHRLNAINRALREAQPRILHATWHGICSSATVRQSSNMLIHVRDGNIHTCTCTYMKLHIQASLSTIDQTVCQLHDAVFFFSLILLDLFLSAAHARATVNYVSQTGTRVTMQPASTHIARPSRSSS